MRSKSHKIVALGLAFLVLFSTLSFSVDMHFCGHTLVDVEIFQKAKGCGMEMGSGTNTRMGCCSDHQVVVAGQDDLKLPPSLDFSPQLDFFLPVTPLFFDLEVKGFRSQSPAVKTYIPPLLFRDRSIEHQVFLI
jgi:hypothetical protein